MAITYGFFNSVNGDRKYNAKNIGRYLQGIVSSGVYADTSSSLQVLAGDGLQVQVQPGRAMLDYHYMENDAPLTLTLSPGSTQDRYDAIMAVLDVTNRLCDIVVKEGTPSSAPQYPPVTRTDTRKEYMLAAVRVAKYATAITQENIGDTRPRNDLCGWVHGLIEQVDTETLFIQYEQAYANKMADLDTYIANKKAEIDDRLESIDNAINNTSTVGVPIPATSNAGQVPMVNSDGTAYELATITHPIKQVTIDFDTDGYYVDVNKYEPGLYLFKSKTYGLSIGSGVLQIRLQNSSGDYVAAGQHGPVLFCLITRNHITNYSSSIGVVYTLFDYAGGTTYVNEYRNANAFWEYSERSNFVESVNGTRPDADGNVNT